MLEKLKTSKFLSRKFILALLGDIIGIVGIIISDTQGDIQCIASIILIALSTVVYIIGESKIDAASAAKRVLSSIDEIEKLVEEIKTNDDKLISSKKNTNTKESE